MDLIHPDVEQYAAALSSPEEALLEEVAAFTVQHHRESHMLSGHVQGKLLQMISHLLQPRRVLEIGTFTGYSALCLATGMVPDGVLHTIELREADARAARHFFDCSVYGPRIVSHQGAAADIIPALNETWDLVFIDADKTGYIEYFNLVLPAVRQNGFILADNIFFHGEALKEQPSGKSAKAIRTFNDYIRSRADIDKVALTIRDGLYLIRKL